MKETKAIAIDSDSARFARSLRSAILWPIGIILFTAGLMLLLILMLLKVIKWSEHSYEVIAETRACEAMMVDAQSQLRGYLLGAGKFSSEYDQERRHVSDAFTKLSTLVRDNPQQKIRADGLARTKDLWFDHAGAVVAKPGATENSDWIKMGDDLMDSMRSQFQTFTQVEEKLHDDRVQRVQSIKHAVFLGGGVLALILALAVAQLVRRPFTALAGDYRSALGTIEQRHSALLRSESALEEQKEWFRVTLTSIADGVIVTDRENRVVFMNHESERLTGWKSVEALLKPLSSVFRIVDEKTRAEIRDDPVGVSLRENRKAVLKVPALLLSKTGEEWPIDDSCAPINDAKGGVLGVVLVFHNATDIRRTQNEMRMHSEELEKRVAERTLALQQTVSELESFSYTVSHDLRSPLRAMQGFAQAVLEDYGDKMDEQGKHYLIRIKNAAERLDRLIQDLLSYTRISRQDTKLVPFDLDKLIHELVQLYPNLHPPAAEVRIQGTLPRVLGHEPSLTQVFSNLLGNAAKFVAAGTSPVIRVWSEDLGDNVRIWIEDNGIGIPVANQEQIFEMFVQLDDSPRFGGTGVGLAIVKKAVESMHGRVGAEAASGGGSQFWVELSKAA